MEATTTSVARTSDRLPAHEQGALSDTSGNANQARGRKKKHGPHTAGRKPGKKAKEAERLAKLSVAGHAQRGSGTGSRSGKVPHLPEGFTSTETPYARTSSVAGGQPPDHFCRTFESPGKHKYHSTNQLGDRVRQDDPDYDGSAPPEPGDVGEAKLEAARLHLLGELADMPARPGVGACVGESAEAVAAPAARRELALPTHCNRGVVQPTPKQLAVVDASALDDFAKELTEVAAGCASAGCACDWRPVGNRVQGNGGSIEVWYVCQGGCGAPAVRFDGARRNAHAGPALSQVGLQLAAAFLFAGNNRSRYQRWATGSGIDSPYSENQFLAVVKYLYPFIVQVLNEDVATARERLKLLGIGAVVSGDGVWLMRGHFSQCGSFTVGDQEFLDALLAYAHAAARTCSAGCAPARRCGRRG